MESSEQKRKRSGPKTPKTQTDPEQTSPTTTATTTATATVPPIANLKQNKTILLKSPKRKG
jgi:hypothetical protein